MSTQPQEEWETKLDLILGESPKGSLKYERRELLRSFISETLSSRTREIVGKLENIREWSEPQKGAGEEIGPLAGTGMYLQYDSDRKKHTKQIDNVIEAVRGEK